MPHRCISLEKLRPAGNQTILVYGASDTVGKLDCRQARKLLVKKGMYLTVGGLDVSKETKEHMRQIASWYTEKKLKAVIDAIYPMKLARIAHQHVDTGHKKGSVILVID